MVHVPYKGGGPALIALISAQVQVMFATLPAALPHVKSGRVRPIAVTTAKRSQAMRELSTIAESGVAGYEAATWYGLLAPARTPKPVIERLHGETVRALRLPDVRERIAAAGADVVGSSPEEFGAFIRNEATKYARIVREANIKID